MRILRAPGGCPWDIEQTHEEAETNGHGEVDNQEANAEQNAYTQGYKCLAAEIAVHTLFNICYDAVGRFSIFFRHQINPSASY